MNNLEEIKNILKKHLPELRKKFGIKELGIFGSYVRSEQSEKSDIDILVEFEEGCETFDNYMGLKFFIEDLFQK
ncbi:MAG: nucleotidyltransferase family protein, partial [Candidatus Omnitrophica bacterium]|nr:nucleotidyltransferase family protein [Candidatus Omnitrophota bacterium]